MKLTMTTTTQRLLMVLMLFGVFGAATAETFGAEAQATEPAMPAAQVERLVNAHWREFARHYLEYDGAFVCFPTYDPRHLNSNGVDARTYQKENKQSIDVPDGRGRTNTEVVSKPKDEIDAATKLLPAFEVGEYGYIHSGEIKKIIDGRRMTLVRPWIVDAAAVRAARAEDQQENIREGFRDFGRALREAGNDWSHRRRWRGRNDATLDRFEVRDIIDWRYEERMNLITAQDRMVWGTLELEGYATDKLTEGKRWPAGAAAEQGIAIAIVKKEGRNVTAVSASALRKGITQSQFISMLETRGWTKEKFASSVIEHKKANPRGYKLDMLVTLENLDNDESPKPTATDNREVRDLIEEEKPEDANIDVRDVFDE